MIANQSKIPSLTTIFLWRGEINRTTDMSRATLRVTEFAMGYIIDNTVQGLHNLNLQLKLYSVVLPMQTH